ncbi:UDP-2,3-diacylglucosamine diphosphatase [Arenimonas caeni]|uniref:UDP-2,3-diacylglucosamine hydrolase n=1 Tax=Arenimonas caeni TaxID=2058085 RepID=A0A2P6MCN6_9GAMM|nr:UDP-2,3-diacylglucosamine diphosphatase [Arenimonas caeni]PRH83763.1 UDP-2,3-diacylglucosamine diphosphatase [Arenimonas caeni]
MSLLLVSDLHLDAARPATTRAFIELLEGEARGCEALYILGDLFEAWVGDDDPGEPGASVCAALKALSDAGVPVFLMRGNRDFLYGQRMAERCGATLLPDPCVAVLQGVPTLLMHGDLLCTDDTAYQAFRRQVRDPAWQAQFLSQPLAARQAFAAQARAASREHQQGLSETITDVNPRAVAETMARYGVTRLIHGHTHRPAMHALEVGGRPAQRFVLGDWYDQGSVLRIHADGEVLEALAVPGAGAAATA